MSVIRDRIDHVLQRGLAPRLKAAGYRKDGRTFRHSGPNAVKLTNLQASWSNVGSDGKFTVNLGVYFPQAAELHGLHRITERPVESDCMVHERIGFLLPVRSDHWWAVDDSTDLDALTGEVGQAWEEVCRPWLDRHADPAVARDFMVHKRGAPWWGAIFSLLLADQVAARSYLEQAISEARRPDLAAHLRRWGERHGLV